MDDDSVMPSLKWLKVFPLDHQDGSEVSSSSQTFRIKKVKEICLEQWQDTSQEAQNSQAMKPTRLRDRKLKRKLMKLK